MMNAYTVNECSRTAPLPLGPAPASDFEIRASINSFSGRGSARDVTLSRWILKSLLLQISTSPSFYSAIKSLFTIVLASSDENLPALLISTPPHDPARPAVYPTSPHRLLLIPMPPGPVPSI